MRTGELVDVAKKELEIVKINSIKTASINRYHQKVTPDAPLYDAKAVHGLANPIDFADPAPHKLWTKQTYASFDISRAVTDKQVSLQIKKNY